MLKLRAINFLINYLTKTDAINFLYLTLFVTRMFTKLNMNYSNAKRDWSLKYVEIV